MGVLSFVSTLPSVIPLLQSTPATATVPMHPFRTISCKVEADPENEYSSSRRHILHCFGATVGMVVESYLEQAAMSGFSKGLQSYNLHRFHKNDGDLIGRSSSFVEVANAADLIQRRQRSDFQSKIKATLSIALKGNPDLLPSVLILSLNDAVTYDKATKSGGPNGSIRFSSEINRPENKGLSGALNLLEEAKKEIDSYSKGGPIAYADLIHFAAQSAVKSTFLAAATRKCGGNEEKGALLYSAYGSSGQWGLFDRQFGRSDAQEPDPEGRVPQWDKASVQEMKAKFSSIGFGPRQLAVMSAFLGPDQSATEALLASDPEVLPWVQKYQRSRETVSQTDYEVDLITTLTKLCSLGQQINYEAYTYPVPRIDLYKLKL